MSLCRLHLTATSFALAIVLCAARTLAQDASAKASIVTKGDAWVGQRVILAIELRVPGIFASAPVFQMPRAPGVLLIPPTDSPTLSSDEADDISYTVQRHEVSVIARRGGSVEIPPLTIRASYKKNPLDRTAVPVSVKTDSVRFDAKLPPGAEKLGTIISARDLTATESWQPDPATAHPRAGDAFTRTIHFAAPDVPAMAFPPFPASPIDGLGIYPKQPDVLDKSDRGQLRGERRDTITYVCQRPGTFVIPAVRLSWFDLDAKRIQTIELPARTLEVAPNPAMSARPTTTSPTSVNGQRAWFRWRNAGLVGIAVIIVGAGLVLLRHFGATWLAPLRPVHLAPLNPTSREVSP